MPAKAEYHPEGTVAMDEHGGTLTWRKGHCAKGWGLSSSPMPLLTVWDVACGELVPPESPATLPSKEEQWQPLPHPFHQVYAW